MNKKTSPEKKTTLGRNIPKRPEQEKFKTFKLELIADP